MSEIERFLRELSRWEGIASPQDIGPITDRSHGRARQLAKRCGLVTYEGGYWRMTDKGKDLLRAFDV